MFISANTLQKSRRFSDLSESNHKVMDVDFTTEELYSFCSEDDGKRGKVKKEKECGVRIKKEQTKRPSGKREKAGRRGEERSLESKGGGGGRGGGWEGGLCPNAE